MNLSEAVTALSALAQETRLEVFRLLVRAGPDGLAMGGIAERLAVPGATLNHHVAQLKAAGLVRAERQGRTVVVRAAYPRMQELVVYLSENCCTGVDGDAASNIQDGTDLAAGPSLCCPEGVGPDAAGKESSR
jgi:ArsR family transcriptional regulator